MKGLELSRHFFMEECLPRIEKDLPEVLPFLAAGLVGEGSECFGYDDEKSRDHDWGPSFCLWVPLEQGRQYAEALFGILDSLPEAYNGFPVKKPDNVRTGLFSCGKFYEILIGRRTAPETADDWFAIPEPKLAAAVNGEVFLDNCGEFSLIRQVLKNYYPDNVRLRYLAENMAMAAQTGQYNYPRSLHRNDPLASGMMRSHFVSYASNIIFILNRTYRPFYKWKYRVLSQLPILGSDSYDRLNAILTEADPYKTAQLIEEQSAAIITELKNQDLINNSSDFMLDLVRDVLLRITDQEILKKPLSMVL